MEVSLNQFFSVELDSTTKSPEVTELIFKIRDYFKNKSYGDDICSYLIGVICVHPNYDQFFKVGRPKYVEDRTVVYEKILGPTHIYKTFSFDIKLNFEEFISSNTEDGLKMIAGSIMETVRTLKYPKKIKDFDKEKFYEDLRLFFEKEKIL